MECECEMKKQPERADCVKTMKPNVSLKTQSVFDQRFTDILQGFNAPISSEEIKAVRTLQLEVERMRAMVITYVRQFAIR